MVWDAEARAAQRRRTWTGGLCSLEEMEERDLDFWLSMTPEERLLTVWSLAKEGFGEVGSEQDGTSSRLQRFAGGVRSTRR